MTPDTNRAARIDEIVAAHLREMLAGRGVAEVALLAEHEDLLPEIELELHKVRLFGAACDWTDQRATPNTADTSSLFDAHDSSLHVRCPDCHSLQNVGGDAAIDAIACSSCGSRFSLIGSDDRVAHGARRVAHFELLEKLGSGGFGAVWKARDTQLDRLVALKLPRRGQLSATEAELFLREARAAAQLHHPGIVSIHEVGREGDSIYIVSELVEGVSLAEWLADQRMSARESAELCIKIAEALAHAHQHGVIHRDLKPANVLLDADGRPHITDFGLARREAGEVTMTIDGQLLGTPAYMSPEQARGDSHTSDARSDIYALGVMLYELLTGEVPFRGATATLLHQAIHDDPPSPRKLNARIPRDLETITLKCLEKDPARRYATASDLTDDLGHYLRGEPILARPVGPWERGWRWCQRRPAVAGLGSLAAALVVVLAIAASLVAWREAERRQVAVAQQRALRRQVYAGDMDAAMRTWQEAIVPRVEEILDRWRPQPGQEDLRGFEWYYLWRNCQRGRDAPTYLHSASLEDCLAFTRDGRHLATVEGDSYSLLDASTAALSRQEKLPVKHATWIEMSPDGSLMAASGTADGKPFVRLWRFIPEQQELPLEGPCPAARSLLFSRDGGLLAAESIDGTVQAWDIASGKPAGRVDSGILGVDRSGANGFNMLAVSADHRLLAAVVDKVQLSLWDMVEARKLRDLAGHGLTTDTAVFSPDGSLLASGSWDNTIKLWNTANGALVHTLMGHDDVVGRIAFSPDGQRLASASDDNTVRLWDVAQGAEVETLRGHADNLDYVAFAPDGKAVASHSRDNTTKIWRLDQPNWHELLTGHGIYVHRVALSPDEITIASGDTNGEIRIWDARQGAMLRVLTEEEHRNVVNSLEFSPHGEWLVVCNQDHTLIVWNTATWEPGLRVELPLANPSMAVFSAAGQSLITASDDGLVGYRRVGGDFLEYHRFDTGEQGEVALAISPDGKLLATGHRSGAVKLWDFQSSRAVGSLPGHTHAITDLEFSPAGTLLASSAEDGGIRLSDVATRQAHGPSMNHPMLVYRVEFLPDGKTLATCSQDHTIGLWDVATGIERGVLRGSNVGVRGLAVSRSGRLIVTGGADLKVRLWRAASPAEVLAAAEQN